MSYQGCARTSAKKHIPQYMTQQKHTNPRICITSYSQVNRSILYLPDKSMGRKLLPYSFTLRFLCTCNSMPRQHVFKTQSSQPHNRTTRHLHAQSTLCLAGKKRRQLFQTVYLCMTFKDLPAPGETNAKDLAHLLPALILQYATAKTLVYNCIHVCLLSTTFTSKFT